MEKTWALLNPFNYFEWKVEMVIQLRSKGLYWVTIGTETEPNFVVEKAKYFNRIDEAFDILFLDISREIIFHIEILGTPNEFWVKFEWLFGKADEMRGHQLENELISLSPTHYKTIEYLFTKFKVILLQLKKCGIDNKYDHLILSILSKLWPKYSVYVLTFHSSKLTTRNWKMHALVDFMESLTQE